MRWGSRSQRMTSATDLVWVALAFTLLAPRLAAPAETPAGYQAKGEFLPTVYRIVNEAEWPVGEDTVPLLTRDGRLIARVPPAFKQRLDVEGSARLRDGRVVNLHEKAEGEWRYVVTHEAPVGGGARRVRLRPRRRTGGRGEPHRPLRGSRGQPRQRADALGPPDRETHHRLRGGRGHDGAPHGALQGTIPAGLRRRRAGGGAGRLPVEGGVLAHGVPDLDRGGVAGGGGGRAVAHAGRAPDRARPARLQGAAGRRGLGAAAGWPRRQPAREGARALALPRGARRTVRPRRSGLQADPLSDGRRRSQADQARERAVRAGPGRSPSPVGGNARRVRLRPRHRTGHHGQPHRF